MPVPEEDIVCRFVRAKDWHKPEQRPKAGAFKGVDLSVWHQARLQEHGAQLDDLQFGSLAQTGQAHYAAGDFARIASEVEAAAHRRGEPGTLDVTVEWTPEHVTEEWKQWAYAHIDVRTDIDCRKLGTEFRRKLSLNSRHAMAPPADTKT